MCSLLLIVGSSVLIGLEDPLEATAIAQRKMRGNDNLGSPKKNGVT